MQPMREVQPNPQPLIRMQELGHNDSQLSELQMKPVALFRKQLQPFIPVHIRHSSDPLRETLAGLNGRSHRG